MWLCQAVHGLRQEAARFALPADFSLFHLKFIEPESNPDPQSWTTGISSREKEVWAGLAFERVCLLHVGQLKRALGIGGVRTGVCSWRHVADDVYPRGAQIDLLIDRADNVVNVCEMKFASGDYVLKKTESENIDNRVLAFKTVTETPKSVYLTLITTNGLVDNEYARKFQNVLFLDSMFVN